MQVEKQFPGMHIADINNKKLIFKNVFSKLWVDHLVSFLSA